MHEAMPLMAGASQGGNRGWAGRIGIEGTAGGGLAALNRMGCSLGAVSWLPGVFVPEYIGPGRILERRPSAATHSA